MVSDVRARRHHELKVLQRRGLRHLPMDTRRHQVLVMFRDIERHLGQVKNKVPDLPEELVLVDIPVE